VLLMLGVGVLVAHLGLLSGGFSGLSLDLFAAPDSERSGTPPAAASAPATETTPTALPPALPEPVRSSRVRWILPKAPEPEPEPPPPVVKKPPPPPPVVEPEPEIEPQTDLALLTPPEPLPDPLPVEPAEEAVTEPVSESVVAPTDQAVPTPEETAEGPPVVPTAVPPAEPGSDAAPGTEAAAGTVQGAGMGLSEAGLPPALVPPTVRLS
jgi:hypothetical protein